MYKFLYLDIKVLLLLAFCGVLASGCNKAVKRPGYKIEEDKLIEMIMDYQIAKAATFKYPVEIRDSIIQIYQEQIFEIYGVDQYAFEHDMNKLEADPAYYKEIYDQVKIRLDHQRTDGNMD